MDSEERDAGQEKTPSVGFLTRLALGFFTIVLLFWLFLNALASSDDE